MGIADKTTMFFITGVSGTGKSTRVHALVRFLNDAGHTPTSSFLYRNICIGQEYLNSFYIIGKEIQRNGVRAYQGLDCYSTDITMREGVDGMFDFLYKTAEKKSVVAESAVMLSSFRSRPDVAHTKPVQVYSRHYFFKSFEDYKKRVQERNNGREVTEKSSMWLSNRSGELYEEKVQQQLKTLGDKCKNYIYKHGDPFEPVWAIGADVLELTGHSNLVEPFKEYCAGFLEKTKPIRVVHEELF